MNVLSLFDGMSCGRIALDQLGIKVDNYYACEIDKYAMQVSQANYPEIIQLGDVCDVKSEDLPKIDLILAGSPCQGFSFAGKQLAFDDPRSALFFEFIRLLKECKPKYFLLENVRMKKEYLQVISEQVSACYPEIPFGIEPTMICSSLVSAQSRKRYYWTNIPNVTQPEQKGIVLRDILETRVNQDRLSDMTNQDNKAYCLTTTYPCARPQRSMEKSEKSMIPVEDTVPNSTTLIYDSKDKSHKPIKVGMNVEEVKVRKHEVDIPGLQQCILDHYDKCGKNKKEIAKELNDKYSTVEHYFRKLGSDFFSIPSEEHWLQLKDILGIKTDTFDAQIMEFEYRDGVYETKQRVYSENGKSPTLTAGNKEQYIETSDKPMQVGIAVDVKGFDIQKRVYSLDGKSPTIMAAAGTGGGRVPKIETHDTPKQVGIATDINGHDILKRVYSEDGKSPTVNTCQGGNREPKVLAGAYRARSIDKDGNRVSWKEVKPKQMLELRRDEKSNTVTSVQKDNVLTQDEVYWRKLTPLECERLQTVPDNYTDHVSNSQRFKMLGNGWTIEVIKHIFKNMERDND